MNQKKILLISIAIIIISTLWAQDRLFTYTYQSGVLNKGQRELEVFNTLRTGKAEYYGRFDNRIEFETGLAKNLQTSFYLNLTSITESVGINPTKSLQTEHEISFSNEWKYKIFDPLLNPFGMALYGEYEIGTTEYGLEGKLIIDKKIDNFDVAANATYELELHANSNPDITNWEKVARADLNLSVAYELNSHLHLTLENVFQNVFQSGILSHNALYSGLGISYSQDKYWINFTVLPQIVSFKGQNTNNLNLDEFEKIQFRLLFSYAI